MMDELENLQQAIAALEAQRPILGDAVVDVALLSMREKLAALESAGRPEAQRKLATVLFLDIAGHTALTRQLDPEEIINIIDRPLAKMARRVAEHAGKVVRFQGDGFKAVFGLPKASEDDALNAIRAGLAIQATAVEIARQLEHERNLKGFAVRVGIATGLVLGGEGAEGVDAVKGESVNLAARLEQAAPVGGILIAYSTYQHVRGVFDLQPLEPISVKGFVEPVPIYLVLAEKPRTFRTRRRGIEGIETRMVGREAELLGLQDAYRAVEAAHVSWGAKEQRDAEGDQEQARLQFITITGEPGLGKSRLLYEFENWVDLQRASVILYRGRARLETRGLPYGLLRDMFAFRFSLSDGDPPETARKKLCASLQAVLGDTEDGQMKAHLVGHLLGFDFSDSPHLRSIENDPQQLLNRALAYLAEFYEQTTVRSPVIALLEDLHWADEASLDTLASLAQALRATPILIVATARKELYERRPQWMEASTFHARLDLHPLSPSDSLSLVDEVLQKLEELPAALRQLVATNAEGNPFYIEELVKLLIDEGVIVTGENRWQVQVGRLGRLTVPPSLTGVLQARLDSLTLQEKTLLQQASVVGRIFWDAAVAYLEQAEGEGLVTARLKAGLVALQRKEMVFRRETSAFPGADEHVFKHALLREVTYESVLKRLRQVYHSRVAEWLIQHSQERSGEFTGLIGIHLEQAGAKAEARVYLQRAGEAAAARFANEEALEYFSRSLALVGPDLERGWDLLLRREEILDRLGRRTDQYADLDALEAAAGQSGDYGRQAEAALRRSRLAEIIGEYELGVQSAQRAANFAQTAGDVAREAAAQIAWARSLWRQGNHAAAAGRAQQALKLARRAGQQGLQAWALRTLGLILWKLGDFPAARRYTKAALKLHQRTGDQRNTGNALNNLGLLAREQGDYPAAQRYFVAALQIARQTGDRRLEASGLCNLALIPYDQGDLPTALEHFKQALAITRQVGDRRLEAIVNNNLGEVAYNLGDFPSAHGYHQDALALARQTRDLDEEASSLRNLGLVAWLQGDALAGLSLIEAALEKERRTGQRRDVLASLISLGAVQHGLGNFESAWKCIAEASDLARQLGNRPKLLEALVGLAAVYWAGQKNAAWAEDATGQRSAQAKAALEEVMASLTRAGGAERSFTGTIFGLRNYLLCVQSLEAQGDARAGEVLKRAHDLLLKQARQIRQAAARRSFLQKIPWHQRILELAIPD